jgi:hypothetical protein
MHAMQDCRLVNETGLAASRSRPSQHKSASKYARRGRNRVFIFPRYRASHLTLRPSSFFLHIYDIPPILLRTPRFRTFARSSFLNTPFALSFQSSDRLTLSLTIYISRTNKQTYKQTQHLPSINITHHIFIKPSRSSSDSPACVR